MMNRIWFKGRFIYKNCGRWARAYCTNVCPKTGITTDDDFSSKAFIIDGNQIAAKINRLLKKDIEFLKDNYEPLISDEPKLGYVLVGNRPDSELYVKILNTSLALAGS